MAEFYVTVRQTPHVFSDSPGICAFLINLPQSTLEALCIEVKPVRSAPFVVLAWYCPPNEAVDSFHLLENSLQCLEI